MTSALFDHPKIRWFFLMTLLLCSWHLDHARNDNSLSRAATVAALNSAGTLQIDGLDLGLGDKAVIDGRSYSDKAPLPALLVTPIHLLLFAGGVIGDPYGPILNDELLRLGGWLCGSIPLALVITLIWIALTRSAITSRNAYLLATLPLLGSFLFVYSGSFYGHLIAALFLLLGYRSMQADRGVHAGLWFGAAVLSEYTLVVFPLLWVLRNMAMGHRKLSLQLIKGGSIPFALLLIYNLLTTGSPIDFAYRHVPQYAFMQEGFGMGLPSMEAIWGLTLSPYRGLFIYTPALLIIVMYWIRGLPSVRSFMYDPILPIVLLHLLLIAGYTMWWGGWSYGPRHLTATAVLLCHVGIPKIASSPSWSKAMLVASTIGLVLAFMAKSTVWYDLPTEIHSPISAELMPEFFSGAWTDRLWILAHSSISNTLAVWLFIPLLLATLAGMQRLQRIR